ncbi:collectrin-like [Erethizon dorsatum]
MRRTYFGEILRSGMWSLVKEISAFASREFPGSFRQVRILPKGTIFKAGSVREMKSDGASTLELTASRTGSSQFLLLINYPVQAFKISHVLLCNVTQRVSFWFVVTDPSKNHTLPAHEVLSAIRMNRNRINNVFFLNDQTLEFLKIPSTLAPPTDPSVPIWIIIFGVIFCIVIVATTLLILSGIRQRRRKNKGSSEVDDTEDKLENMGTIANSIPCDSLDMKGGHINDIFMTEDERLTPL